MDTTDTRDSGFSSVLPDPNQSKSTTNSQNALFDDTKGADSAKGDLDPRVNGNGPVREANDDFFSDLHGKVQDSQSVTTEDDIDKMFQDAFLGNVSKSEASDPFGIRLEFDEKDAVTPVPRRASADITRNPFQDDLFSEFGQNIRSENVSAFRGAKDSQSVPQKHDVDMFPPQKIPQSDWLGGKGVGDIDVSMKETVNANPFSLSDADSETDVTMDSPSVEVDPFSGSHGQKTMVSPKSAWNTDDIPDNVGLEGQSERSEQSENMEVKQGHEPSSPGQDISITNPFMSGDFGDDIELPMGTNVSESDPFGALLGDTSYNSRLFGEPYSTEDGVSEDRESSAKSSSSTEGKQIDALDETKHDLSITNPFMSDTVDDVGAARVEGLADVPDLVATSRMYDDGDTTESGKNINDATNASAMDRVAFDPDADEDFTGDGDSARNDDGKTASLDDSNATSSPPPNLGGPSRETNLASSSHNKQTSANDIYVDVLSTEASPVALDSTAFWEDTTGQGVDVLSSEASPAELGSAASWKDTEGRGVGVLSSEASPAALGSTTLGEDTKGLGVDVASSEASPVALDSSDPWEDTRGRGVDVLSAEAPAADKDITASWEDTEELVSHSSSSADAHINHQIPTADIGISGSEISDNTKYTLSDLDDKVSEGSESDSLVQGKEIPDNSDEVKKVPKMESQMTSDQVAKSEEQESGHAEKSHARHDQNDELSRIVELAPEVSWNSPRPETTPKFTFDTGTNPESKVHEENLAQGSDVDGKLVKSPMSFELAAQGDSENGVMVHARTENEISLPDLVRPVDKLNEEAEHWHGEIQQGADKNTSLSNSESVLAQEELAVNDAQLMESEESHFALEGLSETTGNQTSVDENPIRLSGISSVTKTNSNEDEPSADTEQDDADVNEMGIIPKAHQLSFQGSENVAGQNTSDVNSSSSHKKEDDDGALNDEDVDEPFGEIHSAKQPTSQSIEELSGNTTSLVQQISREETAADDPVQSAVTVSDNYLLDRTMHGTSKPLNEEKTSFNYELDVPTKELTNADVETAAKQEVPEIHIAEHISSDEFDNQSPEVSQTNAEEIGPEESIFTKEDLATELESSSNSITSEAKETSTLPDNELHEDAYKTKRDVDEETAAEMVYPKLDSDLLKSNKTDADEFEMPSYADEDSLNLGDVAAAETHPANDLVKTDDSGSSNVGESDSHNHTEDEFGVHAIIDNNRVNEAKVDTDTVRDSHSSETGDRDSEKERGQEQEDLKELRLQQEEEIAQKDSSIWSPTANHNDGGDMEGVETTGPRGESLDSSRGDSTGNSEQHVSGLDTFSIEASAASTVDVTSGTDNQDDIYGVNPNVFELELEEKNSQESSQNQNDEKERSETGRMLLETDVQRSEEVESMNTPVGDADEVTPEESIAQDVVQHLENVQTAFTKEDSEGTERQMEKREDSPVEEVTSCHEEITLDRDDGSQLTNESIDKEVAAHSNASSNSIPFEGGDRKPDDDDANIKNEQIDDDTLDSDGSKRTHDTANLNEVAGHKVTEETEDLADQPQGDDQWDHLKRSDSTGSMDMTTAEEIGRQNMAQHLENGQTSFTQEDVEGTYGQIVTHEDSPVEKVTSDQKELAMSGDDDSQLFDETIDKEVTTRTNDSSNSSTFEDGNRQQDDSDAHIKDDHIDDEWQLDGSRRIQETDNLNEEADHKVTEEAKDHTDQDDDQWDRLKSPDFRGSEDMTGNDETDFGQTSHTREDNIQDNLVPSDEIRATEPEDMSSSFDKDVPLLDEDGKNIDVPMEGHKSPESFNDTISKKESIIHGGLDDWMVSDDLARDHLELQTQHMTESLQTESTKEKVPDIMDDVHEDLLSGDIDVQDVNQTSKTDGPPEDFWDDVTETMLVGKPNSADVVGETLLEERLEQFKGADTDNKEIFNISTNDDELDTINNEQILDELENENASTTASKEANESDTSMDPGKPDGTDSEEITTDFQSGVDEAVLPLSGGVSNMNFDHKGDDTIEGSAREPMMSPMETGVEDVITPKSIEQVRSESAFSIDSQDIEVYPGKQEAKHVDTESHYLEALEHSSQELQQQWEHSPETIEPEHIPPDDVGQPSAEPEENTFSSRTPVQLSVADSSEDHQEGDKVEDVVFSEQKKTDAVQSRDLTDQHEATISPIDREDHYESEVNVVTDFSTDIPYNAQDANVISIFDERNDAKPDADVTKEQPDHDSSQANQTSDMLPSDIADGRDLSDSENSDSSDDLLEEHVLKAKHTEIHDNAKQEDNDSANEHAAPQATTDIRVNSDESAGKLSQTNDPNSMLDQPAQDDISLSEVSDLKDLSNEADQTIRKRDLGFDEHQIVAVNPVIEGEDIHSSHEEIATEIPRDEDAETAMKDDTQTINRGLMVDEDTSESRYNANDYLGFEHPHPELDVSSNDQNQTGNNGEAKQPADTGLTGQDDMHRVIKTEHVTDETKHSKDADNEPMLLEDSTSKSSQLIEPSNDTQHFIAGNAGTTEDWQSSMEEEITSKLKDEHASISTEDATEDSDVNEVSQIPSVNDNDHIQLPDIIGMTIKSNEGLVSEDSGDIQREFSSEDGKGDADSKTNLDASITSRMQTDDPVDDTPSSQEERADATHLEFLNDDSLETGSNEPVLDEDGFEIIDAHLVDAERDGQWQDVDHYGSQLSTIDSGDEDNDDVMKDGEEPQINETDEAVLDVGGPVKQDFDMPSFEQYEPNISQDLTDDGTGVVVPSQELQEHQRSDDIQKERTEETDVSLPATQVEPVLDDTSQDDASSNQINADNVLYDDVLSTLDNTFPTKAVDALPVGSSSYNALDQEIVVQKEVDSLCISPPTESGMDLGTNELDESQLIFPEQGLEVEDVMVQHSSGLGAFEGSPDDGDYSVEETRKDTMNSDPLKTEIDDLHALMRQSSELDFEQLPPTIVGSPNGDDAKKKVHDETLQESASHHNDDWFGTDTFSHEKETAGDIDRVPSEEDVRENSGERRIDDEVERKEWKDDEVHPSGGENTLIDDKHDETTGDGSIRDVEDDTRDHNAEVMKNQDTSPSLDSDFGITTGPTEDEVIDHDEDNPGSEIAHNHTSVSQLRDAGLPSELLDAGFDGDGEEARLTVVEKVESLQEKKLQHLNLETPLKPSTDIVTDEDSQDNVKEGRTPSETLQDIDSSQHIAHGDPSNLLTSGDTSLETPGLDGTDAVVTNNIDTEVSTSDEVTQDFNNDEPNHSQSQHAFLHSTDDGLELDLTVAQIANLEQSIPEARLNQLQTDEANLETKNSALQSDIEELVIQDYNETTSWEPDHVERTDNTLLSADLQHSKKTLNQIDVDETSPDEHSAGMFGSDETSPTMQDELEVSDRKSVGEMSPYSFDDIITSPSKPHLDGHESDEASAARHANENASESEKASPSDDDHSSRPVESETSHDMEYTSDELLEKQEILENQEQLYRAADIPMEDQTGHDLQSEMQSVECAVELESDQSHLVKRELQNQPSEDLSMPLDQSIAPSWTGQIITGDGLSESIASGTDYYEQFRMQSAEQDLAAHQQVSQLEQLPVDTTKPSEESSNASRVADALSSPETTSSSRPEAAEDVAEAEDVVAVTTRMTTLEAEKGRALLTDVSSLMDGASIERPESSVFGTPPEDMHLQPSAITPPPGARADARKPSDPLGADLGTGRTELEKGRVTPETLAADEEQDDQFEDGAELEYDETIGDAMAWRMCVVAGKEQKIDMSVIEPYTKVLSHGGYMEGDAGQSIVVFAACHLPERGLPDYAYIMDNLFLYVLTTLDELVAEEYILVYLHGGASAASSPTFAWLRRAYQLVDRRLRKTLKGLYLVHPSFWLRTIVALTRPFISTKFSRKLRYVDGLRELSDLIPMNHVVIPEEVKQVDFQLMIQERKKELNIK